MTTYINSFKRLLLTGAVLAAFTGCDSSPKQDKTQKEAAVKQWNQARAGVMHNLGRDQFQTGNFDKARSTVDEALSIDPDNVALYVLSARIAIEQNRLDIAEKQLAEARKRNEKDADALYLSGVVSQRWQKQEEALAYYVKASEAQPTELAYLMARAEMLVLMNRRPEALSALQDKVIYFEHSAALRDAVGQLLMQDKRYAQAVDLFRQASVLASDDLSIKERLALAQFHAGDYRNCADLLTRITAAAPYEARADLMSVLGESQLLLGRNVEARQAFGKATEIDPSLTPAWLGLAKSALALGDLRRADGAVRRAVSLSPDQSDAYLLMGYLRVKEDRADDAIRAFQTAASMDRTNSVSLCMIGHVLEKQGKHDEALAWYGRALKINPQDELALRLMATAQIE